MAAKRSNLQSFLDSITPSVESYFLFKSPSNYGSSIWHRWGEENFVEYFTLYDLWESLYEWSVSSSQSGMYWNGNEYYNRELLSQSSSTLSIDSMFGKMDLGDAKKNLGNKYFEYFEMSSPYIRMPLVDKVRELAQNFPSLESLNSMELSPASWMSIFWQPIYTIPAQLDKENCGACFLTYHSLSSSFQDDIHETLKVKPKVSDNTSKEVMTSQNKVKQNDKIMTISLPPFGLASLKANEALWNNPETGDNALAESLCSAAGSWLQQVQAHHHDYNFFISQRKN
ncbi:hypothetical protein LUZ63_010837 [Rhynchospora breviuscula]|uniref:Uncharacterized protein n=1 Tax=Rhynchospora breviuscula TaxID=2022672 RepID=A0A9Q0HPZ7_9POAL|nr:hypothetical protein LUZ63_010837 [Rhynchospora breviuscula]